MRLAGSVLLCCVLPSPARGAHFVDTSRWPRPAAARIQGVSMHSDAVGTPVDSANVSAVHLSADEELAITHTKLWIEHVVVRLRLCPYASKPFVQDEIRYVVSDADDDSSLLEAFFEEALLLLSTPVHDLATTMLVAPEYTGGIQEFYELYERLTDLLESDDETILNNEVQPAFFHPAWSFDGLPEDSAIHFEKRAPHPVINLLRRQQLDEVVQEGLERGVVVNKDIAEHNAARLEEEGHQALCAAFESIRRARSA